MGLRNIDVSLGKNVLAIMGEKTQEEELMMAYIIDGLLIGLKREEVEVLIEEKVKVIMESIESIRKVIEEE
jgi:hypothetical protein